MFKLPQLYFFVSIAFGLAAWAIVAKQYIWPKLSLLQPAEALRPLLILHSFRFIGLAFLVPGSCRPICRLASRIPPPTETSLRRRSRCSRWCRCHAGLAS